MFLILLAAIGLALGKEAIQAMIGQTYKGFIAPWRGDGNFDIYIIKFTELIPGEDLVLLAKSGNPRGDPNIFVSTINREPVNKALGEVASCDSLGLDICVVESSKLKVNEELFVAVVCNGYCRYSFKAIYEQEFTMTQVDDLEFRLDESTQTEIIRIVVGELSKSDVEFSVSVSVKNIYEMEEAFHTYLNVGDDIPSSNNAKYKGLDTWSGAQVFELNSADFKSNQHYTLLIQAQGGAIIEVKTRVHGIIRDVLLYEEIEDVVSEGQYQLFRLDLEEQMDGLYDGQAINFQMSPFSGFASFYIHPDTQPGILDSYQWKYTNTSADDVVITKKELVEMKASGKLFYLAVYGITQLTTYRIYVQLVDQDFMLLDLDQPTSGKMTDQEIMNYQFIIKGQKHHDVTVTLANLYGNTDLIVKQCGTDYCKVDKEDIRLRKERQSLVAGQLFQYQESYGTDVITFQFDPLTCNQGPYVTYCLYVAAIYPRDDDATEFGYQITVSTPQSHTLLKENTPFKEFVQKGQYNHYKYIVSENDAIHRLAFVVTPIQGEPQAYSSTSKDNKRPSKENSEKSSVQYTIAYGGRGSPAPQAGSYYISVYGWTSSLYTITPIVVRQWSDMQDIGKFPWHYIQLFEGDPHFYHSDQQDQGLFKIDLGHYKSQFDDQTEPVIIELQSDVGQFTLLGFDHPTSNNQEAIWKGESEIQLNYDDPQYPQVLYLKVIPTNLVGNLTYTIAFRVGWKLNQLIIDQSFYGYLTYDSPQVFEVPFHKSEDLTITKHADYYDQSKLHVSIMLPDTNSVILTDKSSYTIRAKDLVTDQCKASNSQDFYCFIYLEVSSKENMFFNLLVSREDSHFKLKEGQPITLPVPDGEDHFYFLTDSQSAEIMVHSMTGELKIMALILKLEDSYQDGKYQYPDEESALAMSLSSQYNFASSLFLSEDLLKSKGCDQMQCVITLTIKRAYTEGRSYSGEYTILQASEVIPIAENQPYVGSVPKKGMKYFKVSMPVNTSLMIVVTPISEGDPDIFVKKDSLPSSDDYDWSSQEFAGDQLVIESGNPISPIMEGDFYIGVFAYTETKFTISVRIGDVHLHQLYNGIPFNMVMQLNGIAYFDYVHYDDQSFKVLLGASAGFPKMFADIYKSNEIDTILTKTLDKFIYTNNGNGYWEVLPIDKSNVNYCNGCHYIIAVLAVTDVDFTITVAVKDSYIYLANNQYQTSVISKSEKQYYHLFTKSGFTLNLLLFSGQIQFYGAHKNSFQELNDSDVNVDMTFERETKVYVHEFKLEGLNDIYTFAIVGKEDSRYAIQCVGADSVQELKYGHPVQLTLDRKESVTYMFRSTNEIKNSRFSLSTYCDGTSPSDRKNGLQHPFIEVKRDKNEITMYKDPNHDYVKSIAVDEVNNDFTHYLEFNDEPGLYFVTVHAQASGRLNYVLTLGNKGLGVLVPSLERMVSSPPGYSQTWEIYIGRPSQLLLSVQMCGGVVALFGSSDKQKLRNGEYEQKLDHQLNKQLVGSFQIVSEGPYYVASKMLKTHQNAKQGQYIIEAQLLDPEQYIPHSDIEPGLDGELTWSVSQSDSTVLTVQFAPVRIKLSDKYRLAGVNYYLVNDVRDLDEESPLNQCNLGVHQESVFIKGTQSQETITIEQAVSMRPFSKVDFNVHARVHLITPNGQRIKLDYFYQPDSLMEWHVQTSKNKRIIKYLVRAVLIIGLIVIIYLVRKNRKLRDGLQYDISARSSLVGDQGIEMNYGTMTDQR